MAGGDLQPVAHIQEVRHPLPVQQDVNGHTTGRCVHQVLQNMRIREHVHDYCYQLQYKKTTQKKNIRVHNVDSQASNVHTIKKIIKSYTPLSSFSCVTGTMKSPSLILFTQFERF